MSKDFENVPKSKGNTLCPMPWNSINLRNNGDLRICCNTNSYSPQRGIMRKEDGTPYNAGRDDFNEARNAIITFESEDGNYKFWMDNRIYFDGAYFFDEDALNPIGNGVTIRRARLAVKVKLHKNWYGEVDMDFAGSAVELKDAYLKYTTDSGDLNCKAGHFRESFSMETTTTSRYVQFIERSLPAKFSPSRHLGFQVNYIQDKYLLSGGVHFNTIGDYEEAELTQDANKDSVTFLSNKKYTHFVRSTNASILVVDSNFSNEDDVEPTIIRVDNAYIGFVKMLHLFNKTNEIKAGISELSNISETSDITNSVSYKE